MTQEQWAIFSQNVSQIYANADWVFKHHGELGLPVHAINSMVTIRNEAVDVAVKLRGEVEES